MPDVIYIFQEDHELVCGSKAQLVEEVRKTVVGNLAGYSENRYHGRYHTDETIPSPYFDPSITTLEQAVLRDDLYFTYLHARSDEDYLSMGLGLEAGLDDGTAPGMGQDWEAR